MVELTISNLIKIILGALIFVIVAMALFWFFKNYAIDFFRNLIGGEANLILSLF